MMPVEPVHVEQPTHPASPPLRRGWMPRWLLIALGLIFVAIGVVGTALPVLPTTPFLLLASACFIRSSPRLNAWLLRSRLFGPFLRDWQQHHGVRLHVKITAVTVLTVAVGLSLWLGNLSWPWAAALIALALVGLIVVVRLRTIRNDVNKAGGGARSPHEAG